MSAETCPTCAPTYCAPARCYCGHDECPAAASYFDVRAKPFHDTPAKDTRQAKSWADREDSTWIDQL